MDIVRRKLILVTIGTYRVKSFAELLEPIQIPVMSDDVFCYLQMNHDRGYNLSPIYGTILQPHQNKAANNSKRHHR